MRRRDFLRSASLSPLLLAACSERAQPPLPPGEIFGASADTGHLLRTQNALPTLPISGEIRRIPLLIIGAGVGGLAAGWRLKKRGFSDFVIVDLESEAGGNSRAGRNAISAYPWGAHYLPLPPPEATSTRELLADLGILQGDPTAQTPVYDERYLCATPQERLYRDGRWEESLMPHLGISPGEEAQQQRFHALMEAMKQRTGRDGRRAFALPMVLSSRDEAILALDRISFADWLNEQKLNAPSIRWLADYACRDDYGTLARHTSAWAGIHYFASREGRAAYVDNSSSDTVLTAPEGNHWLVRGMADKLTGQLHTGWLAVALEQDKRGVTVDLWSPAEQRGLRYYAKQIIFAAPVFVFARIARNPPSQLKTAAQAFSYAPWLVANLSLSEIPAHRGGASLAWDNVFYDSDSLGYVVATHQHLKLVRGGPSVFTWYRTLADFEPARGRQKLLDTSREVWAEAALADIARAHPDIRELTTRIDIARHGHAMVRPTSGFLWGGARQLFEKSWDRVHFAHADVSGLSLFEEAHFRGVSAAERVLPDM